MPPAPMATGFNQLLFLFQNPCLFARPLLLATWAPELPAAGITGVVTGPGERVSLSAAVVLSVSVALTGETVLPGVLASVSAPADEEVGTPLLKEAGDAEAAPSRESILLLPADESSTV